MNKAAMAIVLVALFTGGARAEVSMIDESEIEYVPYAETEIVSGAADPIDWTKPYAVLGRGVKDRKSGMILQLACRTEPVKNSEGELQCAEVQFIEVNLSGEVKETGRVMKLGVDFNSTQDFRKLLKKQVKELKLSGELPGREVFSSTKNWFGQGRGEWFGGDKNLGTKLLPVFLGAGVAVMLASGGAPILGVIGCSLFGAFPIGIDVILIPLGIGVNAIKGDYFIGNKAMSVYGWVRDRDPKHWQFKPKNLSPKNYQRFKTIVSSKPRRVIRLAAIGAEGGDGHRTRYVQVRYKDGREDEIPYPSNLILISKAERRVYDENGRRVSIE